MPNLSDFSTACLIWLARVRRETVQPWPCRRPRTAGEPGNLTADCLQAEPGGGRGIEPPLPYRVDGLAIRCITALPSLRRIAVRNRGPAGDPVPGAALATPRSRMWRFGLSMRGRALPPGPPSCPSVSPYCCRIPAAFPLLSYCGGGGICMPRSTAGRLPTASNQRFTFGKSARSICCHSRRNTQG